MIRFDERANLLSIHTRNATCRMKIDPCGVLLHLCYGGRTEGNMDYLLACLDRGFSGNPNDAGRCCAMSFVFSGGPRSPSGR